MKISRNEKMILWGLVRYPMLNDRQLSERINVRMSTLNAIKNKMKRNGLIHDRLIPNIEIMDFEILSINWMVLNKPVRHSKRDIKRLTTLFKDHPNTYTAMIFEDTIFSLSLYKNYTQYTISEEDIIIKLKEMDLYSDNRYHSTIYPISLSSITKNFDYRAVLERGFSIEPTMNDDKERRSDKILRAKEKIYHLSRKEKTILKGILENPDMPDNKIAARLDTTRQAVARHKKELLDLGVIKKSRVIDYGKMGFNILCLAEAKYEREHDIDKLNPDTGDLHLPSFFAVYGRRETVSLSLFRDFGQFTETKEQYTGALNDFCTIKEEPSIHLFSPKKTITIKHQEYLPLIEQFLKEN